MGGAPFSFPDQSGFPLGSVYLRAKKNKNGHRALQNGGFPSKSHRNKWAQDLPKWTFRGLLRTAKAKRGELQGLQLNNTKPLKTPQLRLPPRPAKACLISPASLVCAPLLAARNGTRALRLVVTACWRSNYAARNGTRSATLMLWSLPSLRAPAAAGATHAGPAYTSLLACTTSLPAQRSLDEFRPST